MRMRIVVPDPAIRVLDAVERWLDSAGAGSAELWLGGNSHRLAR